MGVLKMVLMMTLVIIGGCTVVVGGCAVGVTKASVTALHSMSDVVTKSHFSKLYDVNPAKAERIYKKVANECYGTIMRQKLGSTVPDRIIEERVNFDLFEIRILRNDNQQRVQYLDDWRVQSDAKIVASLENKRQRLAVKRYLKDARKGILTERMCIANDLSDEEEKLSNSSRRHSSTRNSSSRR